MADTDHFRLFVAMAIPEEVKARIADVQTDLRRILPKRGIRWTRREQFHLTLRFLGDVEAARVEALERSLRAACHSFAPLHLRAQEVGLFPGSRNPRVVWIGVRDDAGRLPVLQQAVEAASASFTSEKKEDRFAGHVTIARIKGINRREANALAQAAAARPARPLGAWSASHIELMRSELRPDGARHSSITSIPLGSATP